MSKQHFLNAIEHGIQFLKQDIEDRKILEDLLIEFCETIKYYTNDNLNPSFQKDFALNVIEINKFKYIFKYYNHNVKLYPLQITYGYNYSKDVECKDLEDVKIILTEMISHPQFITLLVDSKNLQQ